MIIRASSLAYAVQRLPYATADSPKIYGIRVPKFPRGMHRPAADKPTLEEAQTIMFRLHRFAHGNSHWFEYVLYFADDGAEQLVTDSGNSERTEVATSSRSGPIVS